MKRTPVGPASLAFAACLAWAATVWAQVPGQKIYAETSCSSCHGEHGEGDVGVRLQGTKLTSDQFLATVRKGVGSMPATSQTEMSDADVEAVYAFLRESSSPPPTPAQVAGREAYSKTTCANCHGSRGEGDFASTLLGTKLEFDKFKTVVRSGSEVMPPTAASDVSDSELRKIYVYLSDPSSAFLAKPMAARERPSDAYSVSPCYGCHGPNATGGICPPLAGTKLTYNEFLDIVRHGKGIMQPTAEKVLSDTDVGKIYKFIKEKKPVAGPMSVAARTGAILSGQNVVLGFTVVLAASIHLGLRTFFYWFGRAGYFKVFRHLGRVGYFRAVGIVIATIVTEGLLNASLWRRSKFLWATHATVFYGFAVLFVTDILIPVYGSEGHAVSPTHPASLISTLSGAVMVIGIVYAKIRYSNGKDIDNGMTRGRDLLFVNLMLLVAVTGFLTKWLSRFEATQWLLLFYMLHLFVIGLLLLSAPFTRFAHALVVPLLTAASRLAEAAIAKGADLEFAEGGLPSGPWGGRSEVAGWKPLLVQPSLGVPAGEPTNP